MEKRYKFDLSIETILIIVALLLIIKYNFDFPLDADVHFVIKSGEEIWQTGGFPLYDSFSWVPLELKVPYINVEWLSCLLLYLLYNKGGFLLITIYKIFIYGLGYFILFSFARKKYGLLPASIAIITGIYLGRWFLSPRALMHSAVLFPLVTYMLLYDEEKPFNKKFFLYLPLIFLIWTNLHGAFLIGLVYVYPGFLINYYFKAKNMEYKEKQKLFLSYLLLMILCLIITFITPYGSKIFWKTLVYFTPASIKIFLKLNTEYQSPLSYIKIFDYYFIITLPVSIIMLIYSSRRFHFKLSPVELYTFIFFLAISLKAVRNIQLFSIACIPIYAFIIGNTIEICKKHNFLNKNLIPSGKLSYIFISIKIICLFFILFHFATVLTRTDPTGKRLEQKLFPTNLKQFLIKNSLPSHLYNHEIIGCYLLFHLYPQYKVSIDTRDRLVYSPEYYLEFNASLHDTEKLIKFLDKYEIDVSIIDLKYHPHLLENHPDWFLLYKEGRYLLYIRNNEKNKKIIKDFKNDKLYYPDIYECDAFLYLNFIDSKDYRKARKYIKKLIQYYPEDKNLRDYLRELNKLCEIK